MKLRKRYIFITLGVAMLAMLLWRQRYVDYVPVIPVQSQSQTGWLYVKRPDLLTDAHVAAMINQLEKYHKRYRMHDGRLQIGCELAADKDLLANFTWKAWGEQQRNAENRAGNETQPAP